MDRNNNFCVVISWHCLAMSSDYSSLFNTEQLMYVVVYCSTPPHT